MSASEQEGAEASLDFGSGSASDAQLVALGLAITARLRPGFVYACRRVAVRHGLERYFDGFASIPGIERDARQPFPKSEHDVLVAELAKAVEIEDWETVDGIAGERCRNPLHRPTGTSPGDDWFCEDCGSSWFCRTTGIDGQHGEYVVAAIVRRLAGLARPLPGLQ